MNNILDNSDSIVVRDSSSLLSEKWDILFNSGAKYRDLNEIFILDLISLQPKHVVDLGCGTGETLFHFSQLGIPVTGIDFSKIAIEKAKHKYEGTANDATFILADLQDLDSIDIHTPSNTLWLCKFVISFVCDKEKFLTSIYNKMSQGDMLLLMTPVIHNGVVYQKEDKPDIAIQFEYINTLLLKVFCNKQIFSNEYLSDRGHIVTFLLKKN